VGEDIVTSPVEGSSGQRTKKCSPAYMHLRSQSSGPSLLVCMHACLHACMPACRQAGSRSRERCNQKRTNARPSHGFAIARALSPEEDHCQAVVRVRDRESVSLDRRPLSGPRAGSRSRERFPRQKTIVRPPRGLAIARALRPTAFRVPRSPTEWAPYPLFGEDFSRTHVVWECRGVTHERTRLLGDVGAARVGDWVWLASSRGSRLGGFLRDVIGLVASTQGSPSS
jgi:hypothetical protein